MLDDYGALLRSGQAAVPDFAAEQAQSMALQLRQRELDAQIQAAQRQISQKQAFDTDIGELLTNPTSEGYARMIAKHPEFATQIKQSHEILDAGRQRSDLTQMAEIYSASANGKFDVAAGLMQRRVDADKAADGVADTTDEAILAALKSGDPVQQKAALGMMGVGLAAITGPDKFEQTLGALTGEAKPTAFMQNYEFISGKNPELGEQYLRTEAEGRPIIGYDAGGNPVRVPLGAIPRMGGQQGGGGPASGSGSGGAIAPAESAVASTLASAGLPPHVVAGFLGNFSTEGGYGGAKGDGGTAHGIAQWREDRLENFKRMFGKEPGAASHEDQAKFVAWEMNNPEAAGMTVQQRDAILAAKTPAQAAALIDQFYERSSGEHRQRRMQAANRYASAPKVRSKQEYDRLPKGQQYVAPDGSVRVKG